MQREELLSQLRQYGLENDVPNITDTNARFLRDLIRIQGTKRMLEIGTANGFSAIQFGIELEKTGGKLFTIEFSPNSYEQAVHNIWAAGLENTIHPILGNALDEIPELTWFFDFVFIDGMKRRSRDFLELVWDKVPQWWMIIIDDVIKFREKMVGLDEYLKKNTISYNVLPIDPDDGVMMMVK